jgi:competence protein ComEC
MKIIPTKPGLLCLANFIIILLLVISFVQAYLRVSKPNYKKQNSNTLLIYNNIFCSNTDMIKAINQELNCFDLALLSEGLVFGTTKFDLPLKQKINHLGLTHIVVASGTQFAFLYLIISYTLIWLRINIYNRAILFAFCGALYLHLGNYSPPLLRSYVTIIFGSFASLLLKRYINPLRTLLYSAIILLFAKSDLVYSLSFYMSYLATIGVILSQQFFDLKSKSIWNKVKTLAFTNFFILALLAPIVSMISGNINLFGLILNIIVIPLLPILLVILLVLSALSLLPSFYNIELITKSLVIIVVHIYSFFSNLESAIPEFLIINTGKPDILFLVVYYIVIFSFLGLYFTLFRTGYGQNID